MKRKKSYIYCEFGKFIKKRLDELGKNVKWLSDTADISQFTIYAYLQGRHMPEIGKLYRIARALDINLVELVEIILKEGTTEK